MIEEWLQTTYKPKDFGIEALFFKKMEDLMERCSLKH